MKLEEKRVRVENLLEMLGLKECADLYVGDEKVTCIQPHRHNDAESLFCTIHAQLRHEANLLPF